MRTRSPTEQEILMSGFYKKAVVWLGLNEEYPNDEFGMDNEPAVSSASPTDAAPTPSPRPSAPEGAPVQRTVGPKPEGRTVATREAAAPDAGPKPAVSRTVESPNRYGARSAGEGTVRAIPMDEEPTPDINPSSASRTPAADLRGGTVRAVPMAKTVKPQLVVPKSFNDAQDVADMFRDKKPVIVNMQSAERDLARRLIDFSSGLCYGLGGQMEKVAKDVYLLTPDDVEVADEHRVVPQS